MAWIIRSEPPSDPLRMNGTTIKLADTPIQQLRTQACGTAAALPHSFASMWKEIRTVLTLLPISPVAPVNEEHTPATPRTDRDLR